MANEASPQPGSAPSSSTGAGPTRDEGLDLEHIAQSPVGQHVRLISRGSNDGHPDEVARLGIPAQYTQSEASSVIRDHGYSLPFSDIAEDRPPEQDLELAGLGTQFGAGDTDSFASAKSDSATHAQNSLEKEIRRKRVKFADRQDLLFLPIDELERIMTYENIYQELLRAGIQEELRGTAVSLCQRGKASRQRIFAVLCMLQMSAQIVHFIQQKIFDRDLPFVFTNNAVLRETGSGPKKTVDVIPLFQSPAWQPIHLESFEKYQGQVAPPIFKLSWKAGEKVLHFALKDQMVLPFMRADDTSTYDNLKTIALRLGGTSIVRRVKIHKAHFNSSPDKKVKENVYFAVKELEAASDTDGIHEDRTLKRINEQNDPHLIRLLATYTYERRFHMIFPWADGNLKDLWTKFSLPIAGTPKALKTVRWMSSQILGLAKALKSIHYCPVDKANIHGLSDDDKKKPHGRHGDLKPENILWFNEDNDFEVEATNSILQIADFGFADFHSKHSKSNVRRSKVSGFTDTYKAPEYDIKHKVSPQYDIWSFGCIVLQFVVWYLRGWQGVDDFSKARTADSKGALIASDTFYGVESGGSRGFIARTKTSVIEMFESLTKNEAEEPCSDYILELLEYIRFKLLKVKSVNRATIDDIVETFGNMNQLCQQLDQYCVFRTKDAKRTDSGLSEIDESVEVADSLANEALVTDSPPLPSNSLSHRKSGSFGSHNKKRNSSNSRVRDNEQGRPRSKLGSAHSSASGIPSRGLGLTIMQIPGNLAGGPSIEQPIQRLQPLANGHIKSTTDTDDILPTSLEVNLPDPQSPASPSEPSETETSPQRGPSKSHSDNPEESPASAKHESNPPSTIRHAPTGQPEIYNEPDPTHPMPLEPGHNEASPTIPNERGELDSEQVMPQSGWKQIKKRVHKRARKVLDWCLCEDGT